MRESAKWRQVAWYIGEGEAWSLACEAVFGECWPARCEPWGSKESFYDGTEYAMALSLYALLLAEECEDEERANVKAVAAIGESLILPTASPAPSQVIVLYDANLTTPEPVTFAADDIQDEPTGPALGNYPAPSDQPSVFERRAPVGSKLARWLRALAEKVEGWA